MRQREVHRIPVGRIGVAEVPTEALVHLHRHIAERELVAHGLRARLWVAGHDVELESKPAQGALVAGRIQPGEQAAFVRSQFYRQR